MKCPSAGGRYYRVGDELLTEAEYEARKEVEALAQPSAVSPAKVERRSRRPDSRFATASDDVVPPVQDEPHSRGDES